MKKNIFMKRDGAMLPLLAVVLVILFIAAALGVDIARMHLSRSELRPATDAAARAGIEALGREQSTAAAVDAAKAAAALNSVAGKGLTLENNNIVFGSAAIQPDGSFEFQAGGTPTNSLQVVGARDASSPDGAVGLLFGPLFGVTDFEPVQSATATRLDRDIALVLDVSGSMTSNGRFEALTAGLDEFLKILEASPQEEGVSLTVYSTNGRKVHPMTTNLNLIREAFAQEVADGFTAIGEGLEIGLDSVLNDPESRPFALKSIVLMTDGRQNRGVDPTVIAEDCAAAGVPVHALTFSAGANRDLMRSVGAITNGTYLHADSNNELIEAFERIATQLLVLLIE